MLQARTFAALGFLVFLQAACASSSRTPRVPASPQAPTESATTVAERTEPPASAAAPPAAADADPEECAVIAAPGEPIATVALSDPVDPSNAPRPSNESERLLFRQIYETLVRIDCVGRVVPGLATSWSLDPDGHTWIVTLRDAAQFSDGSPVTAADVLASWRHGAGDALHPDVSRLIESIVPLADRTLAIRLQSPVVDIPMALAHADLAVAKAVDDSEWPLGTRATRIAPDPGAVPPIASSAIMLERDNVPSIRVLVGRDDLRDLLDHGVDILLTRDPATLRYAATLPQYATVPLAWQRMHVLLTPGRSPAAPSLSDDMRQALADDAVRGEARGAQGPFWWELHPDCAVAAPSPSRDQSSSIPRIAYDAGDDVARDLAERFVGLGRTPSADAKAVLDAVIPDPLRTVQRATGLTAAAFAAAQQRGAYVGYVVSLDNRSPDPCRDLQALQERTPWLNPATIVPLVETRLQAIVRRGAAGVTAEWDGGLLIARPTTR